MWKWSTKNLLSVLPWTDVDSLFSSASMLRTANAERAFRIPRVLLKKQEVLDEKVRRCWLHILNLSRRTQEKQAKARFSCVLLGFKMCAQEKGAALKEKERKEVWSQWGQLVLQLAAIRAEIWDLHNHRVRRREGAEWGRMSSQEKEGKLQAFRGHKAARCSWSWTCEGRARSEGDVSG